MTLIIKGEMMLLSGNSRFHRRLDGLARAIELKLSRADDPGQRMSIRERKDLKNILSIMNEMLKDDTAAMSGRSDRSDSSDSYGNRGGRPCRNSNQYLNTQCEFFDLNANRIQCAIGCDMYFCTENCRYATNTPGSLPPYCTKYMKGRL